MEHINKIVREHNYNSISKLINQGIPYSVAIQLSASCLRIYNLNNLAHLAGVYANIGVYFLDYYTMLIYKRNENRMTRTDRHDYFQLGHLENFQELLELFQQTPDILLRAADASYQFEATNLFGKINMMKNLSYEDDRYMNSLVPVHEQDQAYYGGWVDERKYENFYDEQFQFYQHNWEQAKRDYVIPTLMGFLKNLAKFDYVNYSANVQTMIAYDYMYARYLLDSGVDMPAEKKSCLQNCTRFVQKSDVNSMLQEFLINSEYMYEVLELYLDTKIGINSYISKEMNDEQLKRYMEDMDFKGYAKIKEFLD